MRLHMAHCCTAVRKLGGSGLGGRRELGSEQWCQLLHAEEKGQFAIQVGQGKAAGIYWRVRKWGLGALRLDKWGHARPLAMKLPT